MRLNPPKNPNYAATIVRIKSVLRLEGCDNVVGTNFFGFQAIVSKETTPGTLGVVFPAETQLSEVYCSENNLFRHSEMNKDKEAKGYLEDNRRVKAIKFRGHRSSALFMPLKSLSCFGVNIEEFKEGDEFDELEGIQVCQKYTIPVRSNSMRGGAQTPKRFSRVEPIHLPEHLSTDNYFKNSHLIKEDDEITVSQKLHGTSIRVAHTIVKRKKTLRDRLASLLFGVKVQEHEFDYVFGSRKVIKDANNPHQKHYYQEDIWTEEGKKLEGMIPENCIIYGELVGWTKEGAPIQSGYTYNLPIGTCRLYIYRVAFVNERGFLVDLSWNQLKEFCEERGLSFVPEIYRGSHKKFKVEKYMDTVLRKKHPNCLPLDDEEKVDEGVCIRLDRISPVILKAKSPKFYEHETSLMDKGVADIESEDSNPSENV